MIADSPLDAKERLRDLWNRAAELGDDLHSLSHRLHSSTLESLGLILGLSSLCHEFTEQQGIQVDFAHENISRGINPDVALCIFRIVQEALRNVKKHSGANRAEVYVCARKTASYICRYPMQASALIIGSRRIVPDSEFAVWRNGCGSSAGGSTLFPSVIEVQP